MLKKTISLMAGFLALCSLFACHETKEKTPEQILFEGIDAIYCTPVLSDCNPCDIVMIDDTMYVNYQGVNSPENSIKLNFVKYSKPERMCEFNEILDGKTNGKYKFYFSPDLMSREMLGLTYENNEGKTHEFFTHAIYCCDNVNVRDVRAVEDSIIKLSDKYSSTKEATQFERLSYLLHSNDVAYNYDFKTLQELSSWKNGKDGLRILNNQNINKEENDSSKEQVIVQYQNREFVYTIDDFASQVMKFAKEENKLDIVSLFDFDVRDASMLDSSGNKNFYLVSACCKAKGKSKYNRILMLLTVKGGRLVHYDIIAGKKYLVVPYHDEFEMMKNITYSTYYAYDWQTMELFIPLLKFGNRGLYHDGWIRYSWNGKHFKYQKDNPFEYWLQ